jgi:hypothetical protein
VQREGVCRTFWKVVNSFDDDNKQRLLKFTTGCDRVPLGGLKKTKFIIARNGDDSNKFVNSFENST